jgi:RNA polymerase sigma-32 factor
MPKKKTTLHPEISSNKTVASKVKRQDVIEIVTDDEDALIDSFANDPGILPAMSETLPVIRKSSDFKVQDPLTLYLKEISKHKLLSPADEKKLTDELIKTGDIEVAKKLVLANLRLVVKIALEYKNAYKNIMDLIQEGNIGLMKAVSKYDSSKGAKLSYYASWWIRSYILKFILDNFRLVKIGTTQEQKKLFYNLMREKQRLISMGINPDVKLLSENLGVSEKSVIEMDQRLSSQGQEVSFDNPVGDDSGRQVLGDFIADEADSVDSKLADLQNLEILQKHLSDFVKELKPRDQEIFKKRLLSEVPESLQSIADQYGVSRERIRQVEERLIDQLKIYMSEFLR